MSLVYLLNEVEGLNTILIDKNIISDELNDDFIIIDNNKKCKYKLNNIVVKEYIVLFDLYKYLDDILKSYNYNWLNIVEQFKKDFYRCCCSINNVKFNDISMFLRKDLKKISIYSIVIMLLTQATMGWPMEKIMEYHDLQVNYVLMDYRESQMYLDVNVDNNINKISIYKRLKITEFMYKNNYFTHTEDKYFVDIYLYFNFDDINKLVNLRNIKNYVENNSTLSWKIVKI
jgi:hypothetical protein